MEGLLLLHLQFLHSIIARRDAATSPIGELFQPPFLDRPSRALAPVPRRTCRMQSGSHPNFPSMSVSMLSQKGPGSTILTPPVSAPRPKPRVTRYDLL